MKNHVQCAILLFSVIALLILASCGQEKDTRPFKQAISKPLPKTTPPVKNAPLRHKLVSYARQFDGKTVYHYAGTSPETGFDCSGFVSYVYKNFDLQISRASAELAKEGKQISLDAVEPGDIVLFGTKDKIQHVAMVVERTDRGIICIHSTSSRGVIVENVSTSSYWKPRILYARDLI